MCSWDLFVKMQVYSVKHTNQRNGSVTKYTETGDVFRDLHNTVGEGMSSC